MSSDKEYFGKHSQTRGAFVEKFTEQTLRRIFPDKFVYRNVIFKNSSGDVVGEADAILLYGYRAFIIQAKSKRLTLASWQGNDEAIARDFQAAVQQAYNQALDCVQHIENGLSAYTAEGPVDLQRYGAIREFFPICVTSEHYPALAFQSSIFLKLSKKKNVIGPIVTDLFTIDVMAEFLSTPLYFTDYLVKRAKAANKLHMSHELVALSWYIKKNLHINDNELFALSDDIMVEIDLAMAVRKMGIAGPAMPEGQLTRFKGTPAGTILENVEASDRPDVHRLGEIILGMDSEAADEFNRGISKVVQMTAVDGQQHDFTLGLEGGGGITIHCNIESLDQARKILTHHCEMRKYVTKSDRWYGVSVALDGSPKLMVGLEFPWQFDQQLEDQAAPFRVRSVTHALSGRRKIGRNEKCPCGSGRKYKHCCIDK